MRRLRVKRCERSPPRLSFPPVLLPPCSPAPPLTRAPFPRVAGEKDELVQPESGALGAMLKRADELAKHGEPRAPLRKTDRAGCSLLPPRLSPPSGPITSNQMNLGTLGSRPSSLVSIQLFHSPASTRVSLTRTSRMMRSPPPPSCHPSPAVKKPREQAVDSELLCTLADFGVEMSKKLGPTGAAAFSARAFVSRLCAAHVNGWDPSSQAVDDPGSFDWNVFGSAVSKHFVHAPTMGFMCVPRPAPPVPTKSMHPGEGGRRKHETRASPRVTFLPLSVAAPRNGRE